MNFFTEIHCFPKLFEYLIINALQLKDLAEAYTLIQMSVLIDKYLGEKLSNLCIFCEFLERLIIFGNESYRYLRITKTFIK